MSLILEALKKSEAERRLGQAPGLMTPVMATRRKQGPSPWWGVLGLAVALLGAAAWWWQQRTLQTEASTDAVSVASSAANAGDPLPRSAVTRSEAPIASANPANDAAADAAPQTMSVPGRLEAASTAPLPRDPEFDSVERESLPIAAAPSPREAMQTVTAPDAASVARPSVTPAPRTPSVAAPAAAQPSATAAPLAYTAPTTAPASVAPALPATPAPLPAPLPVPEQTATASTGPPLEDLPRFDQMLPSERERLPPLKLSMLVYAEAAESRFVLIDGRRHAQGARIGTTLRIEEIRRDGAVIDFDGRRFLLPRP